MRRKTRFWSPHLSWVWNPTIDQWLAARLSCRSCTTAWGRLPVRGSTRPTGFIGPKRSVSSPARGDHLDGQAPLEEELLLEIVDARALGVGEGLQERPVLGLVERAVEVVVPSLAVARGPEGLREVDRVGLQDRAHRVEEVQVRLPHEGGHVVGEGVRGQGAGRHDGEGVVGDPQDLAAVDLHPGQRLDRLRHAAGEEATVDGQGAARRHLHRVGHPHHERAQAPHLLLEEARGLVEGVATEAVRADELGEVAGLVDRRLPRRAHLEEVDLDTPPGELPRGLAAGEAAPDDRDARSHRP